MDATPRYSRSQFLAALGAVGVGAALGPAALAGAARAQEPPTGGRPGRAGQSIFDLTFAIVEQYRLFGLLAPGFEQLQDPFDADSRGDYAVLGATSAPLAVEGGALRFGGDAAHGTTLRSATGQVAPFATVLVDVEAFSGDAGEDAVVAGLVRDEGHAVLATYDRATGQAAIEVWRDGERTVLGTQAADLVAPFRFAFVVNENEVVALADTGEGPQPVLRRNVSALVDVRSQAVLAEYRNGFGARAGRGGTVLGGVEAGYWGQAGTRDPHVVTEVDGTPHIRDNQLYLTLTLAGLGFFQQAHWGVFTLDLDTYELRQVANLFFTRGGRGLVFGDHAGHIVVDRDRFVVANSTWGDFGRDGAAVQINYASVTTDVLSGIHVIDTAPMPLPIDAIPDATAGQWDPHVVRIRGRWYVAFVNARRFFDFFPVLASGRSLEALSYVGADLTRTETEGTVMQKVAGVWHLLTSSGVNDSYSERYAVYDLDMRLEGFLDAPHPTQIPWPMVTPIPLRGGRTKYILTTFNIDQYREDLLGYGTHGDVIVMEATPEFRGYEFPPPRFPR